MEQVSIYISDSTVRKHLSWPMVVEATREALSAVSNIESNNLPVANQPPRSFTWTSHKEGALLSMPGYVGRYSVGNKNHDTLGCKLVTAFRKNSQLTNPLPRILANIVLLNSQTGQMECIMDATEITAWRTAGASLNATKFLFLDRQVDKNIVLAIFGCGVQGRSHSIGMCSTYFVTETRLWNRTKSRAESLAKDLEAMKNSFRNTEMKITIVDKFEDCALEADVICTTTFSDQPVLYYSSLKGTCHINAIGAGVNHYSELDGEIYKKGQLYVDSMTSAKKELDGLDAEIVGEVGQVINGSKPCPQEGVTVFQSMGMACEDILVAQCIYDIVKDSESLKISTV